MKTFDYVIGNPPYQKRLPSKIMNKLVDNGLILFLLPISYDKYTCQKPISRKLKLIQSLPTYEAYTDLGLRTCIQIWSKTSEIDLRHQTRPRRMSLYFDITLVSKFAEKST
jgi:hypothetical protein